MAVVFNGLNLGFRVKGKVVDGHDNRQTIALHVLDVAVQVGQPLLQCRQLFIFQVSQGRTTVVFQCPHRSHDYQCVRRLAQYRPLDVQELLGPQISTEAGFSYRVVCQLQSRLGSQNRVAAVSNVGKWAPMNDGRRVSQRLNQVWL